MPSASSKSRKALMNEINALIKKKLSKSQAELAIKFVQQYYKTVSLEDLLEPSITDLCGAFLSHWKLMQVRKLGQHKIRIYNPTKKKDGWESTHTVIEMVLDDMPFLVDSVRMEVNRFDYTPHLTIHVGALNICRDKANKLVDVFPSQTNEKTKTCHNEAAIFIEIDRESDTKVLKHLQEGLERVIEDVTVAVADWQKVINKIDETLDLLEKSPPPSNKVEIFEAKDFLHWIKNDHFTFLGYREYEVIGEKKNIALKLVKNSGLGVLCEDTKSRMYRSFSELPAQARRLMMSEQVLMIHKTNTVSTVHRPTYTDGIDVKLFDRKGKLIGIRRFIGLYTSTAYTSNPKDIPFLRLKVATLLKNSKLPIGGHASKVLQNIIETLPRDDLFQATPDELLDLVLGILSMQERARIRLFVRHDIYNRYVSCLVYVPRERFNTSLRQAMQGLLQTAFQGYESTFATYFSESILARIHFVIRTKSEIQQSYDLAELQAKLVKLSRLWEDDLYDALLESFGKTQGNALATRYMKAFPAGYREQFAASIAITDIEYIEALENQDSLGMSFYRTHDDAAGTFRFKLYRQNCAIPLSDVLPMLENMGLRVISEVPFMVRTKEQHIIWINDFLVEYSSGANLIIEDVKDIFQDAFAHIWRNQAENDGFNALVLAAKLNWREVSVLRAYAKYFRQIGFTFSQEYIQEALMNNPAVACNLIKLFGLRFDPALNKKDIKHSIKILEKELATQFDRVVNLDEDRIMRRYRDVMMATIRTNYYQLNQMKKPSDFLSFKFSPAKIPDMPQPLPMFEIFVYSPRFEGVHLRGSNVARGGLRWSDRREDFRTEVLGLMKAQQVKNAVIVPSGAKGGFVVKQLPVSGTREEVMNEVIDCYENFICGLLCITDNYKGTKLVPPANVVRFDEDDPYLVVAADKGTATFSDIANKIAIDNDFWLGDAFASGGATGYDHKKMGITAKGAWESVKRHFIEMEHDTQTMPFTVIGIGDMAGDVFGNGMLLSRSIKLIGAFNHMHIFLDPTPDPEKTFLERQRLFNLPRSSWSDFNTQLISKGGGVFDRSAKAIILSREIKTLLGVKCDSMVPNDLIKAMMKAEVDLIWNGGIGTFVKASSESHLDVGDRTNDAIRVNGCDLNCKVFCEGGNLGATQLGRVEYSLLGGKINTDFIDNSAGVDCSDHEVNIKILLNEAVSAGKLTILQRNKLLAKMTNDVSTLVLNNNYRQTRTLSLMEIQAFTNMDLYSRYIQSLEKTGLLNRALEFLPDDQEILERKASEKGLSRPELAVLMAYSKLSLKASILDSNLTDDPYLSEVVCQAFPKALHKSYRKTMDKHRLQREIIATQLSNDLINDMGITTVSRLYDETGAPVSAIVRAYFISKQIYGMQEILDKLFALDGIVSADIQNEAILVLIRLVRRATRWFLRNRRAKYDIKHEIENFVPSINLVRDSIPNLLMGEQLQRFNSLQKKYTDAGIPKKLAATLAASKPLFSSLDIADASLQCQLPCRDMAAIYFQLGDKLDLSWFREEIMKHPVEDHWDALARAAFRDDLDWQQRGLSVGILQHMKNAKTDFSIDEWIEQHAHLVERWQAVLADLRNSSSVEFTMFSVALRELMDLTQTGILRQ